jgi:hypothetical protein
MAISHRSRDAGYGREFGSSWSLNYKIDASSQQVPISLRGCLRNEFNATISVFAHIEQGQRGRVSKPATLT